LTLRGEWGGKDEGSNAVFAEGKGLEKRPSGHCGGPSTVPALNRCGGEGGGKGDEETRGTGEEADKSAGTCIGGRTK